MSAPFLAQLFSKSSSPHDYVNGSLARVAELCAAVDQNAVVTLIDQLSAAITRDATIFLIGNGGCSALASHWVDDLSTSGRRVEPPIRALSLTDNIASLTCIANDAGYEAVFSDQLRQHLRPADLVIALSVSGNSQNLVRAVEFARAKQATCFALCGFDGGWLAKNSDHALVINSTPDEYGPVQDVMSAVLHAVSSYITQQRGEVLSHS